MPTYWLLADKMKLGRIEVPDELSPAIQGAVIEDYAYKSSRGSRGIELVKAQTQKDMPIYKLKQG